ncbi:unnamed protein product [Camellia sinensis]
MLSLNLRRPGIILEIEVLILVGSILNIICSGRCGVKSGVPGSKVEIFWTAGLGPHVRDGGRTCGNERVGGVVFCLKGMSGEWCGRTTVRVGRGAPYVRGWVPHVRQSGQIRCSVFIFLFSRIVSHFWVFLSHSKPYFLLILSKKHPQTLKLFDY